ncbi:hypothetical protein LMG28688_03469 [Paraburkholderia caffeinitolerans]|uniref:DUF4148 domain-containing protein n=1 Tax=Paraburkholderia caffeinitolerans TaxID=1723730 RepID=A0A6J5G7S9_9BURK|nr:DUF4148 domain-containing protein [Paraburkholderia caffeinitolerans]CAB3792265.1 hypothetical protein LMG28688_03469 [Paraburkholderia caffeinitolerans]
MNAKFTIALTAIAIALGATSAAAQAQSQAQGKTRAEVQQELIQARHDGLTQSSPTRYPPNAQQIAQNKARHQAGTHRGEPSASVDQHDLMTSR